MLADPRNTARADFIVVADKSEVELAAKDANVTLPEIANQPGSGSGYVKILDDGTAPAIPIKRGQVSLEAGERVMHQLRRAVDLAKKGEVDAIVFTPLNKTSMRMAGMDEHDQLRWFAKKLDHKGPTSEINIQPALWTSRVTSHVALKDVSSHLTKEGINDSIELLNALL